MSKKSEISPIIQPTKAIKRVDVLRNLDYVELDMAQRTPFADCKIIERSARSVRLESIGLIGRGWAWRGGGEGRPGAVMRF